MKIQSAAIRLFLAGALAWAAPALQAATNYVATTGSDTNSGTTAASPFLTIQKGIDTAAVGDTVLVGPGTYATGSRMPAGSSYSRVVIEKDITVRSTHGASQTIIQGQSDPGTLFRGPNAIRCAYMTAGTLDGFSLINGFAGTTGNSDPDDPSINGGGVYAPVNCRTNYVNNCIITGCGAYRGGGAYWSTLNNCTVVSNHVNTTSGVGVWGSWVRNSIVFFNPKENYSSPANSIDQTLFTYSCTTPAPGFNYTNQVNRDGGNNITNSPLFVTGTLQPNTNSPCVNAGNNAYASGDRDAAGNARIREGIVDIGAFESSHLYYPLTVINGSGAGTYMAGTVVPILANTVSSWTHFTGWVGDIATVADTNAASTTLIMQPAPMTVTATYSLGNLPEIISSVFELPHPVTVSNISVDAISLEPPEVRLGPVADNDIAFFSTVYTNAGTLIFPWRVSCESGYDTLALVIDTTNTAALISGEVSGVVTQFVAGAGAHLIQWIYSKDYSEYEGQDAGWVGAPTWIPDALAAELGVPGKRVEFPYGLPGAARPFPYGFAACFIDTNAPAGAIGGAAVKLGGLSNGTNGVPLISDSQTTGVETTLYGAGALSFQWRSSCQNADHLICSIDGAEAAYISGSKTNVWFTFTTNLLTVATHTVRWSYAKSPSGISGLDCGWVDSVTWEQFKYVLTVVGGSGGGTNAIGTTVVITADPAPAGQEFDVWDGDTATIANPAAPTTTVVMPGRSITVRALYKTQALSVTVINGRDAGALPNLIHESTGEPEGAYPAGAFVRIVAATAPLWQTFDHWVSTNGAVFADAFAPCTYFTMPPNPVRVAAVYRVMTKAEELAEALTIRGQPLAITSWSTNGVVALDTGGIRYNDPVVKLGGPSVGPNQSVSLTTTNFTGNGYLFFCWRGDAEADYDGVKLEVNGILRPKLYSEKDTNSVDKTVWYLYGFRLSGVTNITWRFTRDDTYYVQSNMVLLDRVTWIPEALVNALDAGACIPNINAEYDPLFQGRDRYFPVGDSDNTYEGEDGGVKWDTSIPGGGALRLGAFGYVTNNQLAQVSVTNWGTGILTWQWTTRSEARYDFLEFLLNGSRTNWLSGKGDGTWTNASCVVRTDPKMTRAYNSSLMRILGFRYKKDGDVSMFEDCGLLRGVNWESTFALQLTNGINTAYVLPSQYANLMGAVSEAGQGVFPAQTQVTVEANPPPLLHYFDRWVGSGEALINAHLINYAQLRSPNLSFVMPGFDVTLAAVYTTNSVIHYNLTVIGGTGSGSYLNGSTVRIEANTAPRGYSFTGWTNDIAAVVKPSAASTVVFMGPEDLTVTATYAVLPVEAMIPLVIGVPSPVSVTNITSDNINQAPPSVRLGPVGNSETAFFETVYTNAGTVVFPWSVNSEKDYDILTFSVDGVPKAAISGEASGIVTNFVPGGGPHTLRWSYTKDSADAAGSDAGTVGLVTWTPDTLAAEFGAQGKPLFFPQGNDSVLLDVTSPTGAVNNLAAKIGGPVPVVDGAETAVEAVFSGAGKLSFHWRTSSELDHDFLLVSIDGAEAARISGTKGDWLLFETNLLTVAHHTVRWTYRKDSATTAGMDCGWVDSVTWEQFKYLLTVENGSGGGTNIVGDTVAITANPAPAGQEFAVWDGDTATIANVTSAATTLVMPGRAITVRALYRQKVLSVTVINGRDAGAWPNAVHNSTGEPEGVYPAGALVRIVAATAPLWQTFDHWASTNGAAFTNAFEPITLFTMPTNPVRVEAVYRMMTEAEKLAGALTIRGQPLVITSCSSSGVVAEATGGFRYNDPVVKLGGPSVGPSQSVSLTTTNFTGNGYLLFWWHSDAEKERDGVTLEVNGVELPSFFSMKETNSVGTLLWTLSGRWLVGVTNLTWRYSSDATYSIHDNIVLLDRVTWIPEALVDALDAGVCVPNINAEYDPLFQGRSHSDGDFDFEGEDGGVTWDTDVPGGGAIRLGYFGYVTNNLLAQVAVTNYGTGILSWDWTSRSEGFYDALGFYIDGTRTNWISGKGDGSWSRAAYVVKGLSDETREVALSHKRLFTYRYQKDADISMFEDCAWLRNVKWEPTYALQLTKGTNTAYSLPVAYSAIGDAVSQAKAGIFPAGTQVTLLAEPATTGLYFDRWTGENAALLGSLATDSHPTFLMPSSELSLTATYTTNAPAVPHYSLTVVSGSGSGSYPSGTTVAIQADMPSLWHLFSGWTGNIATVANAAAPATTVVMGTNSLVVTATYAAATPEVIISTLIGVPAPVTVGNITVDNLNQTPPYVRLGPVGNSQSAFFQTVYTNAGTVIFPWSVDSEEGYDFLTFSVDGTNVASLTGKRSGVVTNFVAGDGQHVLRWSYTNDVSDTAGAAAGIVGTVTWVSDALSSEFGAPGRPLFFPQGTASILLDLAPPTGAVSNVAAKLGGPSPVADGAETAVEAVFSGAGTLSFYWRVSSELNRDFLAVSVDGAEMSKISGNKTNEWLSVTTNLLSVANHIVRWTYRKDGANTNGMDCGWVDSVTWKQSTYVLKVMDGSGSGTNAVGATVAISANAAPAGQEFDVWDNNTETVADLTSPTTTLVMPPRDITVRALYKTTIRSVTMINGRDAGALTNAVYEGAGDRQGAYPAGAFVRIVAATAPLWQTFDHWESANGTVFAVSNAPITYFTMPTNPVTVQAVYREMTENEKLANALTIAGQELTVTDVSSNGVVAGSASGVRYNDPVVRFGGSSVGPSQTVSLTITNFTGDGVLLYWYRATAESRYDRMELVSNGTNVIWSTSGKGTAWQLSTNRVSGATSLTFRFMRDSSYFVRDNTIFIDRVIWIPQAMIDTLGMSRIPDINGENAAFSGEDGGVAWDDAAPAPAGGAIRMGRFGYVNNSQYAKLTTSTKGTGVYAWEWASNSEADYDTLDFVSDGEIERWVSGKERAWAPTSYVVTNLWLPPGYDNRPNRLSNLAKTHEFMFKYSKDSDVSVFEDCSWFRGAKWTPTFMLYLYNDNNTTATFTFPSHLETVPEVLDEATKSIYPVGTQITLFAHPPTNSYFASWTGDVDVFTNTADIFNPNPTFLMPGYDVLIELNATYTLEPPTVPRYVLTVVDGTGGGTYTNGSLVAIQANDAPAWHTFSRWTGDTATVANATAPSTTVLTGTNTLAVTATFVPTPVESVISLVIGVPSPVTSGNLTLDNINQAPPSVRLGPVGNNQSVFFQTVYTNAGTVIFPWSVDSEAGYDFLTFSVDGTNVASISGQKSGVVTNFVAGNVPHVLRWAYTKDSADAAGADAGTVGTVTWIPDVLAAEFGVPGKPLFFPQGDDSVLLDLAPPAGAVNTIAAKLGGPVPVVNGAETAVEAVFSGAGTLSFHWRVSSELDHDFLLASIDGAEAARISGTKGDWLSFETNLLTVAHHTVRWTYRKDSANKAGMDCGWVDSVTWEQFKYLLTVENGSGGGTNNVGDTVAITAGAAPAGQQFDAWDGDTETITDVTSPATTLVMPGRAIIVRALYKKETLSVSMINGRDAGALPNPVHESTGEPEGAYPAGAFVRIVAATAPLWQTFDHWASTNGATFASASAPITYFTMPTNPVRVEAVYRVMTEAEKLAGALTVAGQALAVAAFSSTGVVAVSTGGVRYNDPVVRFGGASVGAGQTVSLTTTNFTGNGILLYWWRATAESRYDKVELVANNTTVISSNSGKGTAWQLSTNWVTGATSLTFRFTRDGTYFVRDNTILIDRVTWIPQALTTLLGGAPASVPNINGECTGFSGVDGGVAWVSDAPSSSTGIRLGRFGYVNNNQHAQLSVTNTGTGIYTWDWATSSEADCDYLDFYADGTLVSWISGKETNWVSAAATMTNRPSLTRVQNQGLSHELLFKYSKDSDVSIFDDCAWLRGGAWTPTFQLTLTSATNTFFVLPPSFAAIPAAQQEAVRNVYPGGTLVTISASAPVPTYYFDRWAGNVSVLPAGGVTNAITTFTMPGYDIALTATYSTNAPSASTNAPSPSAALITGLAIQQLTNSLPPTIQVVLDFEGSSQTAYEVLWDTDLASPFSLWHPLDIRYCEVFGDTPAGLRLLRFYGEIPAPSTNGFFRIRTR